MLFAGSSAKGQAYSYSLLETSSSCWIYLSPTDKKISEGKNSKKEDNPVSSEMTLKTKNKKLLYKKQKMFSAVSKKPWVEAAKKT